ncbi:MAG: hypothetical protein VZQ83_08670 [Eubacterium sp.]|nr:hypothetical protein [Eubacterium sp.]
MRKLMRKLNAKREGATLVTVVIATAFLIAIGVIILAASTRYLVSVYMDRNSNENLYDAEAILAEVRAGVLEYAGEAGAEAYKQVVENYETEYPDTSTGGVLSLKDRFAQLYICGIIQQLKGGNLSAGITQEWGGENFNVNDLTIPVPEGTPRVIKPNHFGINSLKRLTNKPEAVKTEAMINGESGDSTSEGAEGTEEETGTPSGESTENPDISYVVYKSATKGYFMTIDNLVIDYTDDAGYRSTIQTDLQLNVPDYKFDGDDTLDAAREFLVVSDGKIDVGVNARRLAAPAPGEDPVANTQDAAEFTGNIYTGGGITKTENIHNSGVLIEEGMAARFNSGLFVSRGSFDAMTGSKVEINGAPDISKDDANMLSVTSSTAGDFYAKNIRLLSNGVSSVKIPDVGTNFSLKTNAYIENDLDIQDAGTEVTLGGKYNGYSYSENNNPLITDGETNTATYSPGLDSSQSDYSSAILINGLSTKLKTDGLKELILAGRTYVSRGSDAKTKGMDAVADIMMGESVAVRSNQLAYLVPDKYIKAQHNPVSSEEAGYTGLVSSEEEGSIVSAYTDPIRLIDFDLLKESKIYPYLNQTKPVTGNYSQAKTEGDGYVFLYLNFKDQWSANKYFKEFYKGSFLTPAGQNTDPDMPGELTTSDLNEKAKSYIVSEDNQLQFDPAYYLVAGHIISNYYADGGPSHQEPSYFGGDDITTINKERARKILESGIKIGQQYVNLQKYLTTKGDASGMRLFNSDKKFLQSNGKLSAAANQTVPGLVVGGEIPAADPSGSATKVSGMINFDLEDDEFPVVPVGDGRKEPQTGAWIQSSKATNLVTVKDTCVSLPDGVSDLNNYKRCLVINKGDVSIETPCAGLIIAKGNVTVSQNFRGLIIAGGDVNVTACVRMESDAVLVNQLMSFCLSDPDLAKIFGKSLPETHNTTISEDCLRYLNWEKNSY